MPKLFLDADSIAYQAGWCEDERSMGFCIANKIKSSLAGSGCDSWQGFIEHPQKHNYRHQIAITKPYKGNRAGKEKPALLGAAKAAMMAMPGFTAVRTMESEDAVNISARAYGMHHSVIGAIDKDVFCQIAGTFWNYQKEVLFSVSKQQALIGKHRQHLTGDSTDNIPGIVGLGPKKAEALIAEDFNLAQCEEVVARAYARAGHHWHYMIEQIRLMHLLRTHNDVYWPNTMGQEQFEQWAHEELQQN